MNAGENLFAQELNEEEVIELLENAAPGSTKKATKYGMKIFQGKTLILKLISYISLTSSDWLLTPGNKFQKICPVSFGRF